MKLIIIAALNRQRVIGKEGKLPWRISDDLKRFKRLTTGHTLLMGRKTYESLGKPLSNRRHVVLTSRSLPGTETYPTIGHAFEALQNEDKVFVIGGGEVFAQLLDDVDEMYLTLVDQDVTGDVFFPPYEHLVGTVFELVKEEPHDGFTFLDYKRIH